MSNHSKDILHKEDRNNFQSLEGLRVLVVDNDADSRILISAVLESYRAQVMTVVSALDALAAMEEFEPNLLLSDIAMPQVDGYELIRQIRRLNPPLGKIPAIAVTAMVTNESPYLAFEAGFQSFLTKPVEFTDLITEIGKVTNQAAISLCSYNLSRSQSVNST